MRRLAFLPLPIALFAGAYMLWSRDTTAQQAPPRVAVAPLRALLVGGGPDPDSNQVAIESNVRYVRALLPPKTPHITLFADGDTRSQTVLTDLDPNAFASISPPNSTEAGRYTFELLFYDTEDQSATETALRAPRLNGSLDGAARRADIDRAFTRLARDSAREGAKARRRVAPCFISRDTAIRTSAATRTTNIFCGAKKACACATWRARSRACQPMFRSRL